MRCVPPRSGFVIFAGGRAGGACGLVRGARERRRPRPPRAPYALCSFLLRPVGAVRLFARARGGWARAASCAGRATMPPASPALDALAESEELRAPARRSRREGQQRGKPGPQGNDQASRHQPAARATPNQKPTDPTTKPNARHQSGRTRRARGSGQRHGGRGQQNAHDNARGTGRRGPPAASSGSPSPGSRRTRAAARASEERRRGRETQAHHARRAEKRRARKTRRPRRHRRRNRKRATGSTPQKPRRPTTGPHANRGEEAGKK